MLGRALTKRRLRTALGVLLAMLMTITGFVPADAVAPTGNSTFLTQTQTQNLGGINGATNGSYLAQSVTFNGLVYYIANGPTTGPELYSTDGTTAGTNLVKDYYAGASGTSNYLTVSNGKLYYSSSNSTQGYEPVVSDGTGNGTTILKDIYSGAGSSSPYNFTQGANGLTYFTADDGTTSTNPNSTTTTNGTELWVTDGTNAGTRKVKDVNTYSYLHTNGTYYNSASGINYLTNCNGKLFFSASDTSYTSQSQYQELWVTDGTTAGTQMVKDINTNTTTTPYLLYSQTLNSTIAAGGTVPLGSAPQNLTCVGTTLYFSADDGTSGYRQLWKTDGTTAGTVKVKGVADGNFPTSPTNFISYNNKLIFQANTPAYGSPSSAYGTELWISDGTASGTVLLKDINANNASSSPYNFTLYGGQVYFVANDYRGVELWKTDGTTVGTLLVKDINQVTTSSSSSPSNLYVWNNKLFFTADNGLVGRELYVTTGTGVTTTLVKDVFPGVSDMLDVSNVTSNQPWFAGNGTALMFVANSPIYGQEMWKTDGTEAGTTLLQDLNTLPGSANAHDAIAFNGKIYFSAASANYGQELWSTDLTSGNTQMVIDIYPGASSSMDSTTSYFTIYNGRLYFTARNATTGYELWSTDGTAAGTAVAADMYPGVGTIGTNYWPSQLTVCNGKLFYAEYTGYFTLLAFDGTTSTIMHNNNLYATSFACLNNTLFFQGQNYAASTYDAELWKSTGTLASTALFWDGYTGLISGTTTGNSSYPTNLTVYNGRLYFSATNPTSGNDLFVTDGSAAPTSLEIYAGAASSSPNWLRVYKNELWFRANNGSNGNDMMSYDGTTLTARDWVAGAGAPSIDTNMVISGNLLWFRGYNSSTGYEIWSSDGALANTGLFEDLSPGSASTTVSSLTAVGGAIMYNTYDSVMGSQPRFVVVSSVSNITFNANGATSGAVPSDIAVMSVSATVPGNTGALVKTGFDFVGWNTNALGTGTSYLPGATITPIVDTTLYAMWASQTSYTITYNANSATGGVVAPPLTGVTTMVTLDSNSGALVRTGYTFGGWNTLSNGGGTNYAAGARYTPTANVTLYAKWTALTAYTITYNLNGATGTVPATQNTYATATVALAGQGSMVAPAATTFAGWNTNALGSGVAYAAAETLTVQASLTLYAQWTSTAQSTLTYDANGSTSGAVPSSLTASATYVVIDSNSGNLRKTGFIFSGWNTQADGLGTTYQGTDNYLLGANVTLYAKWVAANYTVTFAGNSNTGGTVPNAITGISVSTTLPANSGNLVRAGYTFGGWNTLASGLGTNYAVGDTFTPTSSTTLYAKWTALPTYTITYNGNGFTGGGAPVAQSGIYSSVTLDNNSGNLVKSGSYFAGWNTQADGLGTTYSAGSTYTPTANITMYALWSNVATYTLSYNPNNSTSGTAPLPQTGITSTATVSTNSGSLSRLGYRFDGWNTLANGTGTTYATGSTITLSADTILYAIWTSVPTYTITFNGNGQSSGSIPSAITSSDASVVLPGNTGVLNKTNYTFNGWNTQADGLGTHYDVAASFSLSANVTLYAEWLGNIYTVTYNSNGSTAGSAPAATSGRGTLTLATNSGALAKDGYTFGGWNTAGDGTGTNVSAGGTYTPSANITLFAKWTALPTYTVTFSANGATGGAAPAAITGVYASTTLPGNTGSMTLSARQFSGWNTLANGTGTTYAAGASYTPVANVTLYALWLVSYSITYDANGATSGSTPAAQTGLSGTVNVASNNGSLANTGYNFAGWNTLANGTGTTYAVGAQLTSSADVVLYAKWTLIPTYTVSYDANSATSGSAPATQTGILSAVTLAANSGNLVRTGFTFSGWNVQANGGGTSYAVNTNITISANLVLYARWIAVFSITYNGNGSTSGTTPATQTGITSNASVAANSGSLAKNGYNFAGWNTLANGTGTSYVGGNLATLTSDLVLYAQWSLIPTFTVSYDANGATGGSPAMAASGVSASTVLDSNSGALTKTGFTFAGWNTQADGLGTSYAAGATFTPTSNVTLFALWQQAVVNPIAPAPVEPKFTVTAIAERKLDVSSSTTQTVTGKNLGDVSKVFMDGVELAIVAKTADSVSFNVVAHAPGMASLTLVTSESNLTFNNFMEFTAPKVVNLSNVLSTGVTTLSAPQIGAIAQQIQRAKGYKSVQLSFGPSTGKSTKITLKDNIALMKLAMKLMQMLPKTVDVALRLTGNPKDLVITFKNS